MRITTILALLLCSVCGVIHAKEKQLTPEEAWQRLKDGNQRFVSGKRECNANLIQELKESQEKQTPYAAILCCSDSRVPAELIFDESLGKLFIIRVAGNVATDVTIGSIEYAIKILNVPMIVILGHEACGVLKAAVKGDPNLPPFVKDLVKEVAFSVITAEKKSNDFNQEVHIAILSNVQFQMQEILEKSEVVKTAVDNNKALIQGGIFHFKDGSIEWCPCDTKTTNMLRPESK